MLPFDFKGIKGMISSKLPKNKKTLSLNDCGVNRIPPSPVYINPILSSFLVGQWVAFRVAICCLLIISILCIGLAFSTTILADDGKKSNWYWCTTSWDIKIRDGFTAADYRFQINPSSEWPNRIPINQRTSAADERYVIYSYIPPKINHGKPMVVIKASEIQYEAPLSLDRIQMIRWAQALPSARPYLARLWDISIVEAIKYGAKY